MTEHITLAHLSDVHLTQPRTLPLQHWNVKRVMGYLNWRRRQFVHRAEVLDRLVADMKVHAADHIAVTGDLVNLGLPSEYGTALRWLQDLGPPDRVTVVPGNHDIYVALRTHPGVRLWADYMQPRDWERRALDEGGDGFPFTRRVGPVALIGVNSAVPTPPFVAAGRLGAVQIARLAQALDRARADGLIRVVLIHHPPLPGQAPPRRALADARELAETLDAHGADLVLHGHNHTDTAVWRRTAHGHMLVAGIASGSAGRRHKGAPLARYNLIRLARDGAGAKIEFRARGLREPGGQIADLDRQTMLPGFTGAAK